MISGHSNYSESDAIYHHDAAIVKDSTECISTCCRSIKTYDCLVASRYDYWVYIVHPRILS